MPYALCMQKILHIPILARDRRRHHTLDLKAQFMDKFDDSLDNCLSRSLIPHDPALADLTLPYFELRLNEGNDLSVPGKQF